LTSSNPIFGASELASSASMALLALDSASDKSLSETTKVGPPRRANDVVRTAGANVKECTCHR
jgi:hypothetical protein